MLHDLIVSLRRLGRERQGVVPALLALALGVGATAATFSVLQAVLLRPLPGMSHASRLVIVRSAQRAYAGQSWGGLSPEAITKIHGRVPALTSSAAYHVMQVTWERHDGARLIYEAQVGSSFFHVLGTRPLIGRLLGRSDFVPGAAGVAVISFRIWESEFNGRSDAIGQAMVLDGRFYQVVGVAPGGFGFPVVFATGLPTIWVPLPPVRPATAFVPETAGVEAVGRLRPGVHASVAGGQLVALSDDLRAEHPVPWRDWELKATPVIAVMFGRVRPALLLLCAAAWLLLLIGIANACSVLLARVLRRTPELALRTALGASRGRIARLVLVEGGVLAAGGGLLGMLLGWWGVVILRRLAPPGLPRASGIAPNAWTLGIACLVAVLAAALVGIYPAWRVSKLEPSRVLSLGSSSGRVLAGRGPAKALLIGEVCLAVLLCAGTGLLLESFVRLAGSPEGYRHRGVATFRLILPPGYDSSERENLLNVALARLKAIPGAEEVGATNFPLLASLKFYGARVLVGAKEIEMAVRGRLVSPDYFSAMGIAIVRGRPILPTDGRGRAVVAILDQQLTRLAWGRADPTGKVLNLGTAAHPYDVQVVGVAADARDNGPATSSSPEIYGALAQASFKNLTFVLRMRPGRALPDTAYLRVVMARVDPEAAVTDVRPLAALLSADLAGTKFRTSLVAAFAVLGLLLCAVGLYGVFSGWVVDRRAEIAIRLALGARPQQIRAMVLKEGLGLACIGVGVGMALALGLGRVLQHFLYETSYVAPLALLGACVVALAVTLCAVFIPAQRALGIDPAAALRDR